MRGPPHGSCRDTGDRPNWCSLEVLNNPLEHRRGQIGGRRTWPVRTLDTPVHDSLISTADRRESYLHVVRGKKQLDDANADAKIHQIDDGIFAQTA